ncbi:hypothetical protein RHMOL_Rhmol11G0169400 [Rhododendron molle]|uniref:Uncharacterized protein n=1 Tax=Rhododendron molle TaxID=49168 RepID=A0ACC0LT94_RHOML|nr:hypothetical protein RHMOL_Rhmol11G0169400 [Rhododendron molle]
MEEKGAERRRRRRERGRWKRKNGGEGAQPANIAAVAMAATFFVFPFSPTERVSEGRNDKDTPQFDGWN